MALHITEHCIGCHACKLVCPENAIRLSDQSAHITPHRCTECSSVGYVAQCASICPVENAIENTLGEAQNPVGSLTPGIAVVNKIHGLQEVIL